MAVNNVQVDTLLDLKAAGLVAASAAGATIIDLAGDPSGTSVQGFQGVPVPEVRGDIVIDISAIEIASGDEMYTIIAQLSNSATFASGIEEGPAMRFGSKTPMSGGANGVDGTTGRSFLPFTNVKDGVPYRYLRIYTVCVGTIATGINYTARLSKTANMC